MSCLGEQNENELYDKQKQNKVLFFPGASIQIIHKTETNNLKIKNNRKKTPKNPQNK